MLSDAEAGAIRVTSWRVTQSEWLKFRTLRSSWLTMALATVSVPGIGIAIARSTANDWPNMRPRETLTLVTVVPANVFTFFVSEHLLAVRHIGITWSTPNVPRIVIGLGLYLTVVAALAMGIGAIVRNVAGGIGAFVGIILVLPVIASALPQTWGDRLNKWLPSNAGQALMSVSSDNTTLSPWRGFLVFAGYAVAALIAAAILLRRRDA